MRRSADRSGVQAGGPCRAISEEMKQRKSGEEGNRSIKE